MFFVKKIITSLMHLCLALFLLLAMPTLHAAPPEREPIDGAQFISQSVPLSMVSGQSYPVSITMSNTGQTTWNNTYRLVSINPADNTTWRTYTVDVNADVARRAQYTFTFHVTAPQIPGDYHFQWQMQGDRSFGGPSPDLVIHVTPSQNTHPDFTNPPSRSEAGVLLTVVSMMLDDDTPEVTPPTTPPLPPNPDGSPVWIGNLAQLSNADTGALPGTMGVGNGAATYNLPIALPPGVAGVQPSLSLSYSSTDTGGVAGLGWSVAGVSSIDRCGRSFAINNTTDVARFLPADRLCLDGQQLILINGNHDNDSDYWRDSAEYRTEIDTFSRIRATLANGHRSFTVETKTGQTLTYGDRADTYLLGQGRSDGLAHRWWLSGSTDRSGNTIGYWYNLDAASGESRLAQIRWGGNTRSGQAMFVKAELQYEARPDAQVAYVSGSHFDARLRLKSIVTSTETQADGSGGTSALRYNLAYELSASSGRSLLKSVQACDAGGVCLPATKFDWGKKDPRAPRAFVSLGGVRQGPNLMAMGSDAAWFSNSPQGMLAFGDFNGDGKTDIMERYRVAANGYQQRLFLSNADGNGWTVSTPMDSISGHVMETGDFDGDGQLDLLVADQPLGQYRISNWRLCHSRLSTGGGFVCSTTLSFPADAFNTSLPPKPSRMVSDFNGDNRDDLMLSAGDVFGDRKYKCLSTGSAFDCRAVDGTNEDMLLGDSLNEGRVGAHPNADMDGDGRTEQIMVNRCVFELIDPLMNPPKKTWVCPQAGVSAYTRSAVGTHKYSSDWFPITALSPTRVLEPATSGVLTSDLNADGLTDMVFGAALLKNNSEFISTNGYVCYSKGSGAGGDCRVLPASGTAYSHEVMTLGDFDGDGVVDVLRPAHDTRNTTNISAYQLCHVGADASTHTCEAWTGPTFYTPSGFTNDTPPPANTYLIKVESQFLGDFNGDGKQDIVSYLGGSSWEISGAADQAMPGQAIDKLVSATNGHGFVEKVDYATVNDGTVYQDVAYDVGGQPILPAYPIKRAPVTRQLVKALSRSNGQGGWLTSRYRYAGNANDGAGRGNLGFARQDVTNAQSGHVTTTWYRQDFPYNGMISASQTTQYAQVAPVAPANILSDMRQTLSQYTVTQPNNKITRHPYVQTSNVLRRDLDQSDMGSVTTTNEVGAYGNVLATTVIATVPGGETFTSKIENTYDSNETTWRLADLKKTTDTRTSPTATVTRTKAYTYDAQGLLLTETQQQDDAALKLMTSYDRLSNLSGLVNKITQSWFDPASNTAQTRMVSDVDYDTRRRFPVSKKNALGQVETYPAYDATSGALKQRIDMNGLVYNQTVDGFGRKRVETAPDGNETRSYEKACDASCPAGAVAIAITDYMKSGLRIALPKLVYSDSAGHVLRTQSWDFDGTAVVADSRYDARGRLAETYWPRAISAAQVSASQLAYDELDRVTRTVTRSDAGQELTATTEYQGLRSIVTNAKGQRKSDTRNMQDKLASSVDALGGTTTYAYDGYGNLLQTRDPAGNLVTVSYDALGRRIALNDPDLGKIAYGVDPLGQVWKQVSPLQSAAGTATTLRYDALGRMVQRSEPDLISYWVYDVPPGQSNCAALKSCGQLAQAYTTDLTGKVDYLRQHSFDALGRPASTTIRLDQLYTATTGYDAWGRLLTQSYQRGSDTAKVFTQRYNERGYVSGIARGPLLLWQATAQDAANRVTSATLGNGLKITREYNPYTGYLSFGTVNNAQSQAQLSESYNYDALGNVKQRAQYWPGTGLVGFTEDFSYDGLNRLITATVAGQPMQSFRYDGIGNLLSKTGVGTGDYVYAPAGGRLPHAVKSIPGIGTLDYDLNGNLLAGAGRALSWTSFDMPRSISKGSENSIFMYGPEHQRARQERNDGTTTYYAGAMEVEVKGGAATVKTYWPMGLGVEIDKPAGATTLNWTHLDRLGSVVAISDAAGTVKEQLAYDSWGKRRTVTGDAIPDSLDGVTDNRGFTGHEMLDKLDLVHMNGRIYDPLLARFMSADPLIQDPMHSQSYNRYTYVWNNPTNLTDPTGFAAKSASGNETENIADRLMRENAERCEKAGGNCSLVGDRGNAKASSSKENTSNEGADKVTANTTPSKQPHTVWEDAKEALLINDIQRVYVTTKKLVTDTVNYVGGDDKEKQAAGSSFRANWQEYVGLGMMLITRGRSSETAGSLAKPGTYRPARALPRDAHGNPMSDSVLPHTQLGTATSRRAGEYTQAREWGYDEKGNLVPIRDIDFTDHGRPQNHTNPHQHDYVPNPTGGTPQHGLAKPMEWP
ncbi:RHS repeat-associated core domain-containing protein [Janthinobacterium sp. 1_2014MBL_MicDiv]|uniref:RHS repeat-associated core domain-containing protein n=1 Tax=Janthinobacterium sp. 1_2014MBL_MicDiv TaxID=1644131 RepID=UPI0018DCE96E|nr:RHS repeat-associated core domain-containing protein [Janthinobacterium sp. 1_2014MBL_MicDiv]